MTSRRTGRWILPKGNVPQGMPPHQAAAIEAVEEGGVHGHIAAASLGSYRALKQFEDGSVVATEVDVFALRVTRELERWKEQHERRRGWFSASDGAALLDHEVGDLVRSFADTVRHATAPLR